MELQMMLCHHPVGSMKQNILHKDSEAAFKSLARILPQNEQVSQRCVCVCCAESKEIERNRNERLISLVEKVFGGLWC